jgi:hypothetical protein
VSADLKNHLHHDDFLTCIDRSFEQAPLLDCLRLHSDGLGYVLTLCFEIVGSFSPDAQSDLFHTVLPNALSMIMQATSSRVQVSASSQSLSQGMGLFTQ